MSGLCYLTFRALPSVKVGPDAALGHIGHDQEDREEEHGGNADPLANLHLRLGRPHQEVGQVRRNPLGRRRRAIGIFELQTQLH